MIGTKFIYLVLVVLIGLWLPTYAFTKPSENAHGTNDETASPVWTSKDKQIIEGRVVSLGQPFTDDSTARISLNGGMYSTLAKADGSFEIAVIPGEYVMDIYMANYIFDRFSVVVKDITQGGAIRVSPVHQPGQRMPHPLVISPSGPANYFTERKAWSVTSLFKNPMMLIMGFTMLLAFVMPKMMNNMDPEELKEIQAMQKRMTTLGGKK